MVTFKIEVRRASIPVTPMEYADSSRVGSADKGVSGIWPICNDVGDVDIVDERVHQLRVDALVSHKGDAKVCDGPVFQCSA